MYELVCAWQKTKILSTVSVVNVNISQSNYAQANRNSFFKSVLLILPAMLMKVRGAMLPVTKKHLLFV